MIPLTLANGVTFYVNPGQIGYIRPPTSEEAGSGVAAVIYIGGHEVRVREDPVAVLQAVAVQPLEK